MKTAFLFPGQGSQFEGMGKSLFEESEAAKSLMIQADEILGFALSEIMISGSAEDLKRTDVTQPAMFVHSLATLARDRAHFKPDAVAGHSLGELTALVAAEALTFEDGLRIVLERARAMQAACEVTEGTMCAVLGMEDSDIESIVNGIDEVVVAANYNCPGQLVISGSLAGIEVAQPLLKEAGARRVLPLPVGGAFHSPLMQPAAERLQAAIEAAEFSAPQCPVYQNVDGKAHTDPQEIQDLLIQQLTSPVRWTQTLQNMMAAEIKSFVEVGGNGKTLSGMVRKTDRSAEVASYASLS